MNAFIEEYKSFLTSALFLVIAMIAAGYSMQYRPLEANIKALRSARMSLEEENDQLRHRLRKIESVQKTKPDTGGVRTMPVFLKRINAIARDNEVIVRQLAPVKDSRYKYTIEIHTDYYTFLRFTAALESLNTVINDLEVRPYDVTQVPPLHVIRFSITPRNDAEPLSSDRLLALGREVQERNKRNPFQRFAFEKGESRPKPVIDLTWIYQMTGIGRDNGVYYATIDRADYYKGDKLDERTVREILVDRVYLTRETRDGEQEYVLRFRGEEARKPRGRSPTARNLGSGSRGAGRR